VVVNDFNAVDIENDVGRGAHSVFLADHSQDAAKSWSCEWRLVETNHDSDVPGRHAHGAFNRGHRRSGFAGRPVPPP
jgi:hypothetical protein